MRKTITLEKREAYSVWEDVETVTGEDIDQALDSRVKAVKTACANDDCGAFFSTDLEYDVPISIPTGLGGDDLEGTRDYWKLTYGCKKGANCGCANKIINKMIGDLLDDSTAAVEQAKTEGEKIREEGEETAGPLLDQVEVIRVNSEERAEKRAKEIYESTVRNLPVSN